MRTPATVARTAVAVVLAGLLAGCGGVPAAPTLAEVGTSVAGADLAARMDRAVAAASTVRTTFDGAGFTASGVLEATDERVDAQLTAKAVSQTVELVRVDGTTWARGLPRPASWTAEQEQATPWLELDATALAGLGAQELGLLGTLDLTAPSTLTRALADVPATVVASDATSTTLQATVSPERLLGDLAAASGVTEPVALTVIVDAQDRPLTTTADLEGQVLQVSYAGWGEDLAVTAPAPATVGRVTG